MQSLDDVNEVVSSTQAPSSSSRMTLSSTGDVAVSTVGIGVFGRAAIVSADLRLAFRYSISRLPTVR